MRKINRFWIIIGMLLMVICYWRIAMTQEPNKSVESEVTLEKVNILVAEAKKSGDKTYKNLEKALYQLGPEAIVYFFAYSEGNDEIARVFNRVIETYKNCMSKEAKLYREAFEIFDKNEAYQSLCLGLEDIIRGYGAREKVFIAARKLQKYNSLFVCKKLIQALERSNFPCFGSENAAAHTTCQKEVIKGIKHIIGEDFDTDRLDDLNKVKNYITRCKSLLLKKEQNQGK